ncbi:uncharacterized protein PHALS_06331 [Plasmopara halstedii]|uniref:Uncharacterized protein n=1 Tax=Plasmopara halstedii TaxID=4781 RepID=A0A0P1B2P3_PLAHL|nr:uncharacterized protein PHALS_06331 [Plasmopara halstedii]CEG48512.1 hypothetical protein PHALS_06331 [Plasmopara halstedii]|eukprot:XP_024584881.1 hypothetical protein PHALS_06331 [Plasmopara halstedii]
MHAACDCFAKSDFSGAQKSDFSGALKKFTLANASSRVPLLGQVKEFLPVGYFIGGRFYTLLRIG